MTKYYVTWPGQPEIPPILGAQARHSAPGGGGSNHQAEGIKWDNFASDTKNCHGLVWAPHGQQGGGSQGAACSTAGAHAHTHNHPTHPTTMPTHHSHPNPASMAARPLDGGSWLQAHQQARVFMSLKIIITARSLDTMNFEAREGASTWKPTMGPYSVVVTPCFHAIT